MNGVLHRLAARAAGTAVTARADARLGGTVGAADGGAYGRGGGRPRVGSGQGGAGGAFAGGAQGPLQGDDARGSEARAFDAWALDAAGVGAGGLDARGRDVQGRDVPGWDVQGGDAWGGDSSGRGRGAGVGPGDGLDGDAWRASARTGSAVPARLLSRQAGSLYRAESFGDASSSSGRVMGNAGADGSGASRTLSGVMNAARGGINRAGGAEGFDGVDAALSGASRRAASDVFQAIHAFNATLANDHDAAFPSRLMASSGSLSTSTVGILKDSRVQATVRAIAQDMAADMAGAQAAQSAALSSSLATSIATSLATSSARGADTEITIHIGRIDVMAVRGPAAKPVQTPAAAATAMSLDTYLSRRQRSGA